MDEPILLLPGMGADARLHGKLRTRRALRAIDWPPTSVGWSLADYAASIIARERIAPGATIGGTSMGGMVALEVARQVPLGRVLLIASCGSWRDVAPRLRRLAHLSPIAPFDLLALTPPVPGFGADRNVVGAMARRADPRFLRWACRALQRWSGVAIDPALVRSIHGTRDRIIPLAGRRADVVVPGAGHILPLTHAAEVSAFIDAFA